MCALNRVCCHGYHVCVVATQVTFQTPIYHPNVDEKGQVCLPIIAPENWKPATKTDQSKYLIVWCIDELYIH